MTAAGITHIDATFYAQVEPVWGYGQQPPMRGARVARISAKRPNKPIGGTVLVRLTLRIPKAAFEPLRPEAVVVIPANMVKPQPIEVEAVDPS